MTKVRTLPAGEFKQTCLAVLDEVTESHLRVVITKRGKPVAELVPIASDRQREDQILESLRGRGHQLVDDEDFLRPLTLEAGWKLGG